MEHQLDIMFGNVAPDDVRTFVNILRQRGWQTRKQLCAITNWSERTVRALAESAGSDVVRGPKGFNYFDRAETLEIQEAARIAERQGNKMLAYASALRTRLLDMARYETKPEPVQPS
jgi:hypothetical protein